MEEDIRDALRDLKSDVRDGFSTVNNRIDGLVTKSELAAELRRVDDNHRSLKQTVDDHIATSPSALENVRNEMDTELERFKSNNRWSIGISVTIAGVLFAIVSQIIQLVNG